MSPLDLAAWVYQGELNAMKDCVYCNWGHATLPGKVDVRFTALTSLFDRATARKAVYVNEKRGD